MQTMRLYFKRAELLLREADGKFVLEMEGQIVETFNKENKAVAAYNRIRRELEAKMPPSEMTDADRKMILDQYLRDTLASRKSSTEEKKVNPSRTFGSGVKPH
jgi:hypothetical protein